MIFLLTHHLYFPIVLAAAAFTLGGVLWWMKNGGNIDPGEPNARIGY